VIADQRDTAPAGPRVAAAAAWSTGPGRCPVRPAIAAVPLTFEGRARTAVPRLRAGCPRIPGLVWRRLERAGAQDFALAVAMVGVFSGDGLGAGQASGGRSRYFQLMLVVFGLHIVAAVGACRYTPGVVIEAPFGARATRLRKAAGIWEKLGPRYRAGTALAHAVFAGSHALTRPTAHSVTHLRRIRTLGLRRPKPMTRTR